MMLVCDLELSCRLWFYYGKELLCMERAFTKINLCVIFASFVFFMEF